MKPERTPPSRDRLLVWALRLWPRELRDTFGAELIGLIWEIRAERRPSPFWRSLLDVILLARAGLLAHLDLLTQKEAPNHPLARLHTRGWDSPNWQNNPQRWPLGERISLMLLDLRLGARQLARKPIFLLATVLLLGLGVGATGAVWTTVDRVLLTPLPYGEPESLVQVWESNPRKGWLRQVAAPANILDWRERVQAFDDVAGWVMFERSAIETRFSAQEDGESELISMAKITGNLFSVLGVEPAAGRLFTWEDTWDEAPATVVLSHRLFEQRFDFGPGRDRARVLV